MAGVENEVQPPDCANYRTQVMVISIINSVTYFLLVFWHSVVLITGIPSSIRLVQIFAIIFGTSNDIASSSLVQYFLLSITILVIIYNLISLLASLLLWFGAKQEDVAKCKPWIRITVVFTGLYVTSKIFVIVGYATFQGIPSEWVYEGIFGALVTLLIQGYQIPLVVFFTEDIQPKAKLTSVNTENPPAYNSLALSKRGSS